MLKSFSTIIFKKSEKPIGEFLYTYFAEAVSLGSGGKAVQPVQDPCSKHILHLAQDTDAVNFSIFAPRISPQRRLPGEALLASAVRTQLGPH